MTTSEFLVSKNIPTNGMTNEVMETIAKANGYVATKVESEIYKLLNQGKLTKSGNALSMQGSKVMALFGCSKVIDLFNKLAGKEIICTVKEIAKVDGKDLSKTVLGSNKANETTGIAYKLHCKVAMSDTSDGDIVFETGTKGALLNEFGEDFIRATFGNVGETFSAKIVKYEIGENVSVGLFMFNKTPIYGTDKA